MTETITAAEYRRRIAARRKGGAPAPTCDGCGKLKPACVCLELLLAFQIEHTGLPEPVAQYRAIPGRALRFDFAYPAHRMLIEVQGGVAKGAEGGHTSFTGFTRDCVKRSLAAIHGWRVIECTGEQVRDGLCLAWIEQALGEETR